MKTRLAALLAFLAISSACADGYRSASGGDDDGTPTPPPSPSPSASPTPVSSGCVDPLAAGHHEVDCDGLTYEVNVPATCPASGCGLILDVHGLSMNGDQQDANTGMRALGEANGFVVVQPNANLAIWSAADYPKVHAFVEDAIVALAIDADRVHATGFSQGGQMTFAMICQWPETFASAAPAAAASGECFAPLGGTPPEATIPVLQIHGTSDVLVLFAVAQAQRDGVIAAWDLGAGTLVDSGTGFARTRYENATSGASLEFLQHDYAGSLLLQGHCFPGSEDATFRCSPPNDFVLGETVMEFFLANPRP